MSFLELQHLQKTFPDGTQAVRGIDLTVEAGEFIVLLGSSGCGKTTTLRMIAGLEMPTGGQILLNGREMTHTPASERDMGFVFQFYALYPHMTVRQNIAFPLKNTGKSDTEVAETIQRVSDALGITPLLNRHPGQLSGGDQQRVSLARAMVRKPNIYLMDEPLGTLDAEHRLELREFIRAQQMALSVTAIYVTHDQEEAMSLADRIVVMDGGKIRQTGSPHDIYNHPADLFVANFVGSPGMNLLQGDLYAKEDHSVFTAQKESIQVPHTDHQGSVTLGIRPEFISPANDGIPAKVTLSEYLGSHHYIHLDTPIGNLIMRTPPASHYLPGENLHIQLAHKHIRLFDQQTEQALS